MTTTQIDYRPAVYNADSNLIAVGVTYREWRRAVAQLSDRDLSAGGVECGCGHTRAVCALHDGRVVWLCRRCNHDLLVRLVDAADGVEVE